MNRRTMLLVAGAGILAAGAILVFGGGEEETPEAQVRRSLDEAVEAAERHDLGGLMERISERFRGRGMDKQSLKGMLFVQLRRGSWTKAVLTGTTVTLQSDAVADVQTQAVLARGEGVIPSDADRWQFDLTFEKEDDGEWRVTRADYRSAR